MLKINITNLLLLFLFAISLSIAPLVGFNTPITQSPLVQADGHDSQSTDFCLEFAEDSSGNLLTGVYVDCLIEYEDLYESENCASVYDPRITQQSAWLECLNRIELEIDPPPVIPPPTDPTDPAPEFVQVDDRPKCADETLGVAISGFDPSNPNAKAEGDHCIEFDENTAGLEDNPIFVFLGGIINFLLAGVGIALVGVIVIGGFQYMTSSGDPQKVADAKKKIMFAIIGMAMYLLSAVFLNWLVPGGLV